MARVSYRGRDGASEELHQVQQELFGDGPIPHLYQTVGHNPALARALRRLGIALRYKTTLDPRRRELAILRVGQLAQCSYEFGHHTRMAPEFGVTPEDLAALAAWRDSPQFDDQDRAVLQYAEELAQNAGASDATFAALKAFLPEDQIVELTLTIAFYCGVVRFLNGLQVDLEPDYQEHEAWPGVRSAPAPRSNNPSPR